MSNDDNANRMPDYMNDPEYIAETPNWDQVDSLTEHMEEVAFEEYTKAERLITKPQNREGYITIVDRDEISGVVYKRMIAPDNRLELSSIKELERLRSNRTYIIDKIFTSKRVHMLAGPSGVNKTSWLLPMIHDWYEGKDVMGFKSNPVPYLYVSCDRPLDGVGEVLERLGLEKWDLHCHSLGSIRRQFKLGSTRKLSIFDLTELFPYVKVFFIEGIASLKGMSKNPNDYAENMQYWSEVGHMCEERDITILGVTHCAKAKPGEKYDNPRDQIIGSVGLPASTDTLLIMQFDEAKDITNKGRKLYVLPRNVAPFSIRYKVGDKGRLEVMTEEEFQEQEVHAKQVAHTDSLSSTRKMMLMDSMLIWDGLPMPFTMDDIVKYAEFNNVSRASAYRWKDMKIQTGEILESSSKGKFVKGRIN
jgi:hypothetical protein